MAIFISSDLRNLKNANHFYDSHIISALISTPKYSEEPGGVMYSTQTTSSWSFTEISDFPLRPEDGLVTDFPKHDIVQRYLERFAEHYGLMDITSFLAVVVSVVKNDENKFVVTTRDGSVYTSQRLCVCT